MKPTEDAGRDANLLASKNALDVIGGAGIESAVNYFVPLKVETFHVDMSQMILWIFMLATFAMSFTGVGLGEREGFYACKAAMKAIEYERFREISYINEYEGWWLEFMGAMGMWKNAAQRARRRRQRRVLHAAARRAKGAPGAL